MKDSLGRVDNEVIGCRGVWKIFGELIANRDVSLSVARGEVHAVIGENGAGKSTLMRSLYGEYPPDRGEVRFFGERIARPSVAESIRRKVGMVHQHFMLVETLTVTENIVLGREPERGGLLDLAQASREIAELGERYGLKVDPDRRVGELSVGEQQRVEIVKVLWRGADVLILDEPTAVLTPPEVEQLFGVLRRLAADGKTVILVTHKLDEVMALSQRITVLRRGEVVARLDTAGTSIAELSRQMVGRDVVTFTPPARDQNQKVRLSVSDLLVRRGDETIALDGVGFEIQAGEILGVASVQGNGESELGLAVTGLIDPRNGLERGRILVDGKEITQRSVSERQEAGVGHIPDDRHLRAMVLEFSLSENVLLGRQNHYQRFLSLDYGRVLSDTKQIIADYDVRPPDADARAGTLSGGNQQKIVVGRELSRKLAVLVCAQPTRGVDIGAIERIHAELRARAEAGVAILLISSELDELIRLAHRIVVLHRGHLTGTFDNAAAEQRDGDLKAKLGFAMLGGHA